MRLVPFLASVGTCAALLAPAPALAARDVAVVWDRNPVEGRIELSDGEAKTLSIVPGEVGAATSGRIVARFECPPERGPKRVRLRPPHPEGRKAVAARGGSYRPDEEAVWIEPFAGRADVTLEF